MRWLISLVSGICAAIFGYLYYLSNQPSELAAAVSFFLVFLGTFTKIGKPSETIHVSQEGGHFSKNDQSVTIKSSLEEK
jgi:hypothetical protein